MPAAEIRTPEDIDAVERQVKANGKLPPGAEDEAIRRIEDIPSVFDCGNDTRTFAVAGFIPEASVTMLTSESGQGKTMLALNIAACVSSGAPFCRKATARRDVLYLDKENPAHVIVERLRHFGVKDSRAFRIWGGWCAEDPPAADCTIVVDWVQATNPKPLIVVDSLIAFHPGAENDSTDTRRYMHSYRRLASLGATVLILHHTGKADTAKDYRGSSDLKASVDCGFHLANLGKPSELERVRLRVFKNRFPVETELLFRFGEQGFEACEDVAKQGVHELLIALLKEHPRVKSAEFETFASDRGLGRDRSRSFLAEGVQSRCIRVDKGDHNARFHTWVGNESDVAP